MSEEIKKYGIEVFGGEELFNKWLYSTPIIMPNQPINYSDEEIKTILTRIEYGIYS